MKKVEATTGYKDLSSFGTPTQVSKGQIFDVTDERCVELLAASVVMVRESMPDLVKKVEAEVDLSSPQKTELGLEQEVVAEIQQTPKEIVKVPAKRKRKASKSRSRKK